MKDTTIRRHVGPEPLETILGMELVYAEFSEKAQKPSKNRKAKRTEEFRLPCSEVLHRLGSGKPRRPIAMF
jgi:hypothetical protein